MKISPEKSILRELTEAELDYVVGGENPHEEGETGNPHDEVNPGGIEDSPSCLHNPNCETEHGNPHDV